MTRRGLAAISAGILAWWGTAGPAQAQEWKFTLIPRGSYTTTSKLYFNPDAQSPDIRSQHAELTGVFGGGLEVRVQNRENAFFLALAIEYLTTTDRRSQLVAFTDPPRTLPVEEGYSLLPIELSGNMYIPLGTNTVRVGMGGGVGAYFGHRILSVAGVSADAVNKRVGLGIHVRTTVEYQVRSGVYLMGEMRFRDPEVETFNRFGQESVFHNGTEVRFPADDIKARVNVHGMSFGLGLLIEIL
ncbi:MAG: hypothetical protein WD295_00185 [Bacteroidota bacterium]